MKNSISVNDIIDAKMRVILYFLSLTTLIFNQNYCINVCPFLDSITNTELTYNLFIVFIIHIITREFLYKKFNQTKSKRTLPRHMYYLSITSWIIAGAVAFILHYIKYQDFPIGSHLKLLSSYWILGGAIISQIEYALFENRYKELAKNIKIDFYNEHISKRMIESFLLLSIAPAITIILVLARYYDEYFSNSHIIQEISYVLILFLITSIIVSTLFAKMLKKDTNTIVENIENIKNGDYNVNIDIVRSDELGEISSAIETMSKDILSLNKEILNTQAEVLNIMGQIAETRSKETGNHVKRVAQYSEILALKYGLDPKEAKLLRQASPMHDIGKVGIPDSILNKPGRHTPEESIIMKTHAKLGYEILKSSNKEVLKASAIVAHEHHEKWDGSGYPRGLKGEDIHIYGRITAVADVFDALGSDRCYKKAWEDERIFNLFKEERGKHFDPKLVDLFFENLDEFLIVRESLKDKFE
jgi:response regulator RpfG family c-di-GMP phosphodiesterase